MFQTFPDTGHSNTCMPYTHIYTLYICKKSVSIMTSWMQLVDVPCPDSIDSTRVNHPLSTTAPHSRYQARLKSKLLGVELGKDLCERSPNVPKKYQTAAKKVSPFPNKKDTNEHITNIYKYIKQILSLVAFMKQPRF